ALPRAPRHRALQLVRGAEPLVSILDLHGEADRILHAEPAPGAPDAALHGAERLAVGMSGLEPRGDQIAPDVRQLVETRAEQIDALSAGDLRVEAVALRHRADRHELIGRHLAAC